ncbi:hypothetical protein ISS05_03940 [Candidatus Woesearchaeota archaeon]|nr:hypothetical protein [Candidatus Woesearchaeota archaeon]
MEGEAQVFVKIEDYKDVLDVLDLIKGKVEQAKKTLSNINQIKREEDSELDSWNSTLDELEQKVDDIGDFLSEPERLR